MSRVQVMSLEQRRYSAAMEKAVQHARRGDAKMADQQIRVAAALSGLPLADVQEEVQRQALIADAIEAEERFGVDACEEFARRQKEGA